MSMRDRIKVPTAVVVLVAAGALAVSLAACTSTPEATATDSPATAAAAEGAVVEPIAPAVAPIAPVAPAAPPPVTRLVQREPGPPTPVLVAAPAADAAPAYFITVGGVGSASAVPDVADIQLGVETIHDDAGTAIRDNTDRMNAVMAELTAMQIESSDIQTVNYNMWVEQVYDREGPTGALRYHVTNQIRVHLRDLDSSGELLQRALDAGANNVGGITFKVEDSAGLKREARDQAVAAARATAEQLAQQAGVTLGGVRQIVESAGVTPIVTAVRAEGIGGAAAPVPVAGGEFSVSVAVQMVFDIER